MPEPLDVAHVVSSLPFGGVETNLLRVLPRLDRNRFRTRVICLREPGDLAGAMEDAGVPVSLVHQKSRYNPFSIMKLKRALAGTHVMHAHMRRANTSGRIAGMLAGVPVLIATEHDMAVDKNRRHLFVDRLLARRTDVVLGVTKGVVEINRRLSGIPAEKFRVMYLGLELDVLADQPPKAKAREDLGLPERGPLLGFVGRLHAIKNVDRIVRAFAEAPLRDARLAVVGDGPERANVESAARTSGVSDRVIFTGYRTDLPTVYAALDGLILASDSEGIATVQMEAVAAGVPLASTEIGLAAEVFTPGREYVAIASKEPANIARGAAELLVPERAEALRAAGREAIRAFGVDAQVKYLENLYAELAAKRIPRTMSSSGAGR